MFQFEVFFCHGRLLIYQLQEASVSFSGLGSNPVLFSSILSFGCLVFAVDLDSDLSDGQSWIAGVLYWIGVYVQVFFFFFFFSNWQKLQFRCLSQALIWWPALSEVVTGYTSRNEAELSKWIIKGPASFLWTPYFFDVRFLFLLDLYSGPKTTLAHYLGVLSWFLVLVFHPIILLKTSCRQVPELFLASKVPLSRTLSDKLTL